ncbi:MAG: 16S rRNA (guanine(966)-N(2))-methyltransferase RsmD [Woeseiaceae bacterium]
MARVKRPDHSRSLPGRLRIVAGKWRSRLLRIVDEPGLRPTSERIRETLFNWLSPVIEGARCLDLFAGTGALGIEALSRGAAEVVFVEKSAHVAQALRKSLEELEASNAEVHRSDALDYLAGPGPQPFDLVFLDPPFETDLLPDLCRLLDEYGWLKEDAIVYLEQGKDRKMTTLPDGWAVTHEKVAGQVSYSLAKPGTNSEGAK